MRFFGRPAFAIAFGAFIVCAETCNHIDSILSPAHWYDLPLYDWAAGVFLVAAGAIARRDTAGGGPYLAAAWGFMVSLLAGAFFAHWEESPVEPALLGIVAGLLAVGICALVSTLRSRPARSPGQQDLTH